MPLPIGYALITLGVVLTTTGVIAKRYHDRRVDEHQQTLEVARNQQWHPERVKDETVQFHTDSRVDWAIRLMLFREVGALLTAFGATIVFL